MRIGFETTVNACGIRLSGRPKWRELAAGHGTGVTGFPGRMNGRTGARHVLRRAPVRTERDHVPSYRSWLFGITSSPRRS
jgi:hypothetical protein